MVLEGARQQSVLDGLLMSDLILLSPLNVIRVWHLAQEDWNGTHHYTISSDRDETTTCLEVYSCVVRVDKLP
jgi:hypothetical protein